MSIINSYYKNSKPIINVENIYSISEIKLDICIFNFSLKIMDALIEDELIELVSDTTLKSIGGFYPIYRFIGTSIGIFQTPIGAPVTASFIQEISYIYSCKKIILFGSCGGLDKSISVNSLIVPTYAYRDEGFSYHYMEPSDYIEIKYSKTIAKVFSENNISFVLGKTWTTDAFYRETEEEFNLRRKEGCIAVEMEISACQAIADYLNVEFYPFLYRADNLDNKNWEKGNSSKMSKDERLNILNVAYLLAKAI